MSGRAAALVLTVAMFASGCGSALSPDQLAAADGYAGTPPTRAAAGAGAQPGAAAATAAQNQAAGTPTAGPAAALSGNPDPGATPIAAPAPAEGNGGATDVGVTADSITLGTITTLTGPLPGLLRGAAIGTQACAAWANSQGGVFGRQLKVEVGDDQLNENQVRALAEKQSNEVLAFVGSFSLYDSAMVEPMQNHGVPDLGTALQSERFNSPLNWSPQPVPPGWQTGGLAYLKNAFPDASQAVGLLEADVAPTQNAGIKAVLAQLGMKLVYEQSFGATTTDFTAQIFRMKTAGVRFLIVTGDYSNYVKVLQNADQQDLKLDVFNPISNAYDPRFIQLAGSLAEGTIIYSNQVLFDGEDAAAVPEVGEFNSWLKRVDAGASPDVFALYGWTACKMFVQAATAIGPNLTREALKNVLASVTSFDGNGLLAQANPAGKVPPTCYLMLQVHSGGWQRRDDPESGFRCDGEYLRL
ncbi:MAG: hypothetical protein QOG39_166 [Acidimicrobiaceae bacterium]